MPTVETDKKDEPHKFRVKGGNWYVDIEMNVEDWDSLDGVLMEAATRGVESYLGGEYVIEDKDRGVTGFGILVTVEHLDTETEWAVPADDVLYNASKHELGKKVTKRINKRKGQ